MSLAKDLAMSNWTWDFPGFLFSGGRLYSLARITEI